MGAVLALCLMLAGRPTHAQTSVPGDRAAREAPVAEPEEKPIGAEAFAEEPVIDLDAARGTFGPARMTFRLATWHLGAKTAKAARKAAAQAAAEPASTWRHTFGSERRTSRWRKMAEAGFGADIVALQGVESPGDARRLFPARRYHVVISRQLLARAGARATGIAVVRDDVAATTALAYRRQPGVRLAGFRHFLPAAASGATATAAVGEAKAAAITAFRLHIYGKLIWVVSIDLGEACEPGDERRRCRQAADILARFMDWTGQLRDGSAPLILLGRWPGAVQASLDQAGFGITVQEAVTREACTPTPSGALLAKPARVTALKADLETQAMPENAHACAHLARVTVHLREDKK